MKAEARLVPLTRNGTLVAMCQKAIGSLVGVPHPAHSTWGSRVSPAKRQGIIQMRVTLGARGRNVATCPKRRRKVPRKAMIVCSR